MPPSKGRGRTDRRRFSRGRGRRNTEASKEGRGGGGRGGKTREGLLRGRTRTGGRAQYRTHIFEEAELQILNQCSMQLLSACVTLLSPEEMAALHCCSLEYIRGVGRKEGRRRADPLSRSLAGFRSEETACSEEKGKAWTLSRSPQGSALARYPTKPGEVGRTRADGLRPTARSLAPSFSSVQSTKSRLLPPVAGHAVLYMILFRLQAIDRMQCKSRQISCCNERVSEDCG